jgi:Na+/proline symporter
VQFTLFLVIGVMLFVFSQHTQLLAPGERTDRIFPTFIVREMPHGLAGLVIAAIFAVAMSNASGSLNSLAASTVLDFRRLRGKEPDSVNFLRLSRRMTLVWGVVLLFFGMVRWGPVLEAGLTVASLPFGSLLGLFLLGTIDRRATARGAMAGMVAGLAVILAVYRLTEIAYTWYVLIGSGTTYIAGAVVSRIAGFGQDDADREHPREARDAR